MEAAGEVQRRPSWPPWRPLPLHAFRSRLASSPRERSGARPSSPLRGAPFPRAFPCCRRCRKIRMSRRPPSWLRRTPSSRRSSPPWPPSFAPASGALPRASRLASPASDRSASRWARRRAGRLKVCWPDRLPRRGGGTGASGMPGDVAAPRARPALGSRRLRSLWRLRAVACWEAGPIRDPSLSPPPSADTGAAAGSLPISPGGVAGALAQGGRWWVGHARRHSRAVDGSGVGFALAGLWNVGCVVGAVVLFFAVTRSLQPERAHRAYRFTQRGRVIDSPRLPGRVCKRAFSACGGASRARPLGAPRDRGSRACDRDPPCPWLAPALPSPEGP